MDLSPERMQIALAGALALAATFLVLTLLARRGAATAARLRDEAERRSVRDRDRAAALQHELEKVRSRSGPEVRAERTALEELSLGLKEMSAAATREEVAASAARALECALSPRQWMVFLANDAEASQLTLAASGASQGEPSWPVGSSLSAQTGRVGLAVRRRAAMDIRDFEAEPPIVRDQVSATEPSDFHVDVVVPVMLGARPVAALACGGPEQTLAAARAVMRIVAEHASAVIRGLDARGRAERIANEDVTTGLGGRSWFQSAAGEAVWNRRRDGGSGALLMFAVDQFPAYVRRNGEAAADRLLRGIAQVLRPLAGDRALSARWRTEEFVVYLDGANADEAWDAAAATRTAVSAVRWPNSDELPGGRVTLSVGVALLPFDGSSVDDLVAAAGSRMRGRGVDAESGAAQSRGAADATFDSEVSAVMAAVGAETVASAAPDAASKTAPTTASKTRPTKS